MTNMTERKCVFILRQHTTERRNNTQPLREQNYNSSSCILQHAKTRLFSLFVICHKSKLFVTIIFFENERNFSLINFKNQIKFKNSFKIPINHVKFQLLAVFFSSVSLHKSSTTAFTDIHNFGLV